MDSIETSIIKCLVYSDEYARKVLPYIKMEYFENEDRVLCELIRDHYEKYNQKPNREIITIALDNLTLSETVHEAAKVKVDFIHNTREDMPGIDWMVDETETYFQDRAVYNALYTAIQIAEGDHKELDKHAIPELLTDALGVSFDSEIGMDYTESFEDRYEMYNQATFKIPFKLKKFNEITQGGVEKGTLQCILGTTNVGKSLCLCSLAAEYMSLGYNVFYASAEMSEIATSKRIDANLLDIEMDQFDKIDKDKFLKKTRKLQDKSVGRLFVKQYPTSSAHVGHLRHTLNELKLKKNFKPDVILLDYINIFASSRYKSLSGVNSYSYVKAIAEEMRGLAIEYGVPMWTATQSNRDGADTTDVSLTNTSESFGLPATVDLMLAIVSNDELYQLQQYLCVLLKSRYSDKGKVSNFMIGVDYQHMKLFDIETDDKYSTASVNDQTSQPKFDKSQKPQMNLSDLQI